MYAHKIECCSGWEIYDIATIWRVFKSITLCERRFRQKQKPFFVYIHTHKERERVLEAIEQSNPQWEKFRGHLGWGWRGDDWEGQGRSSFVFCVSRQGTSYLYQNSSTDMLKAVDADCMQNLPLKEKQTLHTR